MPGRSCETRTRVRYAETDGQRVAHHAAYLVWFELGRADLLRACGVDYNALEDRGLCFVVVEAQVRYLAPARYDDLVTIRTTLESLRSREMVVVYSVLRESTVLATGQTRLALVDRTGRATALPDDLSRALSGPEPPERGDAIISPIA
ncbi:MAG: acyl-CoA thioesterase [Candidatus Sericytochromatia bacterium]|nr:acyl-CoA thioesterase [Candidatus Tanganyikabacteria bacterium]